MTEYRMAPSGEVYEDRYVPPNADWSLVAVIPYEDHGAVARLVAEWRFARGETTVQRAQNALRGYVLPPKLAEPTGWGAVVEDRDGAYWTLYAPEAGAWINYREGKRLWSGIDAVRVVSEGVTDE